MAKNTVNIDYNIEDDIWAQDDYSRPKPELLYGSWGNSEWNVKKSYMPWN